MESESICKVARVVISFRPPSRPKEPLLYSHQKEDKYFEGRRLNTPHDGRHKAHWDGGGVEKPKGSYSKH